MSIQEIVNRPNNSTFETKELEFVVQSYIKDKKGVNVDINLSKGNPAFNDIYREIYYGNLQKLNTAFDYACKYYLNK